MIKSKLEICNHKEIRINFAKVKKDLTLFLAVETFVKESSYYLNGIKVLNDSDLAQLFEIDLIEFRKNVKENIERFPSNFMIETNGSYAFTEAGVIMLGGILESERAIKYHIQFIRYFVDLGSQYGISMFDVIQNIKNLKQQ